MQGNNYYKGFLHPKKNQIIGFIYISKALDKGHSRSRRSLNDIYYFGEAYEKYPKIGLDLIMILRDNFQFEATLFTLIQDFAHNNSNKHVLIITTKPWFEMVCTLKFFISRVVLSNVSLSILCFTYFQFCSEIKVKIKSNYEVLVDYTPLSYNADLQHLDGFRLVTLIFV